MRGNIFWLWLVVSVPLAAAPAKVTFNRDVRAILSENCYKCHGPDAKARKAKLRLDVRDEAVKERKGGAFAIVPGDVDESELVYRIHTDDTDEIMPPPESKLKLTIAQKATLKKWVAEGAVYESHWAYVRPQHAALPKVNDTKWSRSVVDQYVLAALEKRGWKPSAEADKFTLIRRVSLDLTGLPPTPAEVKIFLADKSLDAYPKLVDRLLAKPTYGEHWARQWLDLARYADSAGYADDQPRTIWAYRDWVIRAFNRNLPFDQFTREQLAGDLFPKPTNDQLIATAFHRNTQTNSEGGTDDEEFRNVAVADRVNTTMATWMGTTIACAQCHDHKYDPLSQEEYFRMFAIFNNTEDADRRNESPFVSIFSEEQKRKRAETELKVTVLQKELDHLKATALDGFEAWVGAFEKPVVTTLQEAQLQNGVLSVEPLPGKFTGAQFDGVDVDRLTLKLRPTGEKNLKGRFVRVTNVGGNVFLHLAEVQVFSGGQNVASKGNARQSTTAFGGPAKYGNDGNTNGEFTKKSTTHTAQENNPWWEVDLGKELPIEKLAIWNRLGVGLADRLKMHRVEVFDANRKVVWKKESKKVFKVNVDYGLDGARLLPFVPLPHSKLNGLLRLAKPVELKEGDILEVTIKNYKTEKVKVSLTTSTLAGLEDALPKDVFSILRVPVATRTATHAKRLKDHFAANNPRTQAKAKELAAAKKQLKGMKGTTTVPVMKEMAKTRATHIQVRGNYKVKEKRVSVGLPEVFGVPVPEESINRLTLAKWLMDKRNPLTARVIANRYWESIFGTGLVRTSEEFGSQGELPSHPELLDWLATELIRLEWDTKAFVKLLVTSAAYRQSSIITPKQIENDPANRFYAHGPRLRLTAEMIRDQALAVSGLLSSKMYGVPVKPYQPSFGVSAAFGPGMDWKTSGGEDKYRRGIYTHWRRTNPYPSMTAFDAPNRNVCTVRRVPTNTPLQALVTMNDPVYIEAAQALARRMVTEGGATPHERVSFGLNLCLSRPPKRAEISRLVGLYTELLTDYQKDAVAAKMMATDPLGPLPAGMKAEELAALTVVGNVLLNLDEMFMKR
jgi:predicted DNA-binding antitoxin AbrB/MazE fold protein